MNIKSSLKTMEKKTILLGEDEPDVAEMYMIALDQAGYNVILAGDGVEVLKKCRDERPDLILLDINMPVKDGFQVLNDISQDTDLGKALKNTPIVMLTNYSNPQDMEYCHKLGATDYIIKSEWTPEYIVKKVQKYLADN